jgi:uncharacterized protein involved in exopolysaccharide biosynthesis
MDISQNKNTQPSPKPTSDSSGFNIDYREIFFDVIKYWWIFIITLVLSFAVVLVMHRYTKPVYRASMSMLIEVRGSEQPQNNMMEGFGLSSGMRQIDNQIAILKSWEMIKNAVHELDFNLSYYKAGRIKNTEMYGNNSFVVKYDSTAPQLINTSIYINYIDNERFTLSVSGEQKQTFIYKYGLSGPSFPKIQHNETYRFGEIVETPWLRIVVYNIALDDPKDNSNYFEFYNPDYLVA